MQPTGEVAVQREPSSAKRLLGRLFEQVVHRQWSRPEQARHVVVLISCTWHRSDADGVLMPAVDGLRDGGLRVVVARPVLRYGIPRVLLSATCQRQRFRRHMALRDSRCWRTGPEAGIRAHREDRYGKAPGGKRHGRTGLAAGGPALPAYSGAFRRVGRARGARGACTGVFGLTGPRYARRPPRVTPGAPVRRRPARAPPPRRPRRRDPARREHGPRPSPPVRSHPRTANR